MAKIVINDCYGGFELSEKAINWLKAKYGLEVEKYDPLPRHDARLVECVETLGSAAASGSCSKLVVRTISGNKYHVSEYDGAEWIETPETMHWVVID